MEIGLRVRWCGLVVVAVAAACGGGGNGGSGGAGAGFGGAAGTSVMGAGGRGTSSGGGRSGSGAGGGTVDTSAVHAFCISSLSIECDLVFQCSTPDERDATFKATFGSSAAECKSTVAPQGCTDATAQCPHYDAATAKVCLAEYAAYACTDLAYGPPQSCDDACFGSSSGSGGATGSGGTGGHGTSGSGGSSGQLPLCPADYETASCPTANESCRLDCPSGLCGCTCSSNNRWSCVSL